MRRFVTITHGADLRPEFRFGGGDERQLKKKLYSTMGSTMAEAMDVFFFLNQLCRLVVKTCHVIG